MVRVKYTGPASALQMQSTPAVHDASKSLAPAQTKKQNQVEQRPRLTAQEHLSLKQQQSLEMVQIMLHVSFGTLFYLREFLPLECFDDRDLKQAQRERKLSYREFINGKARADKLQGTPGPAFGQGKRGQPLKIIIRNSDPKADMLLDVLEHGIFDALNKKVLEAIQLTILVDKETPSNVLESYTFSFKYSGAPGDVDSHLESLALDPVGCVADMKTAQTARTGLEMIVRRLITLSAFFPTLPNKRSLGIHLFYTEDCPREYEPPGFATAANDTINYPLNETWRKESQSCGVMDSGFHAVGLKVTSLKWTGPEPDPEASPEIPQNIEYPDAVPRAADIGLPNDDMSQNSSKSENGSSQEATQDIAERQKLQMMIPARRTSPSPDADLIPTQPINSKPFPDKDGGAAKYESQVVILSPNKASEISQYVKPDVAGNTAHQNRPVRCQCAWEGEEPPMIECAFCHSRQHLPCYGFQDQKDPRIPDIHACYQCLLGSGESQLLREMNTLVILRRALGIILAEGFPSKTSIFTQKLHCNGNTVVQITDLLKRRGFIQPTSGYKRKGFHQSGLPKYHIPRVGDVHRRMEREVLDPLVKIQHHYFIQQVDESTDSQKIDGDQRFGRSGNFQGEDVSMNRDDADDQETQSSDSITPQSRKRRIGTMDSLPEWPYQSSLNATEQQSRLSGPQHFSHDMAAGQETPKYRSTSISPEGSLRRSERKKRKISNYRRLIDVGAATSSDDGT
ncbi:meiosis specific protein Hop1 [Aspergillus sp. HF37]|nr:meiosis specific protein Hop1 [Aspergillus sp. HF37]